MPIPPYDVVISFAGEDRSTASEIARGLTNCGINVFYDDYEKVNLWGKDLYVHLSKIYQDEGKYCLMLISSSYAKKQWTTLEKRAAQARAFQESQEYILPIRLDGTKIDGILDTTGYINFNEHSIEEIVEMLRLKVSNYNDSHGISAQIVRAQDVLKMANITAQGRNFEDRELETSCPTCNEKQNLFESPISLDSGDTLYNCKNGCQTIVVIGRPGMSAWKGRGYRLGNYTIRNTRDIFIYFPNGNALQIPAASAALMKKKPEDIPTSDT